ncbi:MAG: GldG family protein [Alistipes sp.]|nr:GldG family protein [Alistipes sp.]
MSKKEKEKEINEVSNAVVDDISGRKEKKKGGSRKLKFGSMSIAVVILVIAVVIVFNLMAGLLMNRYPIKIDLTPDNRHEISEDSIEVMKDLKKDVEITVTMPRTYFDTISSEYKDLYYQSYGIVVECPYDIIPELLDKYSVYAESGEGSVSVKYVDISKNPDVVTKFSENYNGEIQQGSIIVSCEDKVKVISYSQILAMITPSEESTYTNVNMLFAGESTFTSAIRDVADANLVKAAVVSAVNGQAIHDSVHSSISYSTESFLSKNGYECAEIDLGLVTAEELIADYDMLIVAAPAIDFSEDIIQKLQDYLNNGGNYGKDMMYIPNFYQTNLPNITAFLDDWKLQVDTTMVLDDENMVQAGISAMGYLSYGAVLDIVDSDLAATLTNSSLPLVAPAAIPVSEVTKNSSATVTPIIASKATSYTASRISDEESDEKRSYNIVMKSTKSMGVGTSVYSSNLLVVGCPFMFDSNILASTNTYSNANVMLNTVNSLTGKEAAVVIPEKAFELHTLSLTSGGARAILVVVVAVIPLLIAAAGVGVLLWRRNK